MTQLTHAAILSQGSYTQLCLDGVDRKLLRKLYSFMLRLRAVEERIIAEYHPADEMRCPVHFCIGQEAAFEFYSDQFGWETSELMDMGPMGKYRIFGADGVTLGGMMDKPPEAPASAWGFYVNVDGIGAAIDRIKANGGQVVMGPHEVPGGSWIVQALDPQGALFALVSTTR